jgi:hypothetical protein
MQKNQDQGQPNETGRTQQQGQQGQDMQNENRNRPEVENPQPVRKVEEPITAGQNTGGMQAGTEREPSNTQPNAANSGNNTGGSNASKDYQRSDIGMQQQGGTEKDEKQDMFRTESASQSDKQGNSNR